MTSKTLRLACALACLAALGAQAQDAEAVARAQRDAANPLRMIIEASKLKPRLKAGEPEPAAKLPPEKVAVRAPAAKPHAATPAPARDASPERVASVAPVVAVAPAAVEAAPSSVQVEAPLSGSKPQSLESDHEATPPEPSVQASPPAPAEPVASPPYDPDNYFGAAPPLRTGSAKSNEQAPASRLGLAATAPAAAPSPNAVLQLADYVEPVLPDRLRRKLQADGEVVLGFIVNPDGSVTDIAVRSASDKALEAVAVDAVRQWRYQPIASAQTHAVQLVFKLRE